MGKLAYILIGFLIGLGAFKACEYRRDIISKEYSAVLVKNHILCYQQVIVEWALADSTWIPIDSLNELYAKSCGISIDSILNGQK